MQRDYTTGELAKLCGVTKRTVQYYDREKIVVPSKISGGGRRIYTEYDLKKFHLVCLYKDLGLTLKEIKTILDSDNYYKMILDILSDQQKKIDDQILELTNLKNKIVIMYDEISVSKSISIVNNEEFRNLHLRKEHQSKMDKITYLLLACYIVILFLSFMVGSILGGIFIWGAILINLLLLLALIYLHASSNAYVCPKCSKKFTITLFKDTLTLNNGKKGKYLKCPYCHEKNWISETYKDN